MKRTITVLFSIAATIAIASPTVASARHDGYQHGYSLKVALAQQKQPTRPATLGVGPRAHDTALRFVTVKSLKGSAITLVK